MLLVLLVLLMVLRDRLGLLAPMELLGLLEQLVQMVLRGLQA